MKMLMRFSQLVVIIFLVNGCGNMMPEVDEGIPYQRQPRENLTVGGQPTLDQLSDLKAEGYTTIINLRRDGEFDDYDEASKVSDLGMEYVHIPIRNIEAISRSDAQTLHEAIDNASGPVLLHCTIGWRASGLFAIENYLLHDATEKETLALAEEAHMGHSVGDVKDWIKANN